MDPVKVMAVSSWPTPQNLRDLCSFLGFPNFYCQFIQSFAQIVHPLNDLTKENIPFNWGTQQQAAFETLHTAFTSALILILWDPDKPTQLEVNASGYATGGALLQKQEDGQWHPVAFWSASMQTTERDYKIYNHCECSDLSRPKLLLQLDKI